jgi:hypothetical protein
MDLVIRDAMFCRHTVLDVKPGEDRLLFEHCTFTGGHVAVDAAIDHPIFASCTFEGTLFLGQPFSPRIASDCHWRPVSTEDSIPERRTAGGAS